MTTKRVSILRDAEAVFRLCTSFLFHGGRGEMYRARTADLSVDARRLALLLRHTSNHYRGLRSSKRVVIDLDRCSGNVSAVLTVTSAMHIKTVT